MQWDIDGMLVWLITTSICIIDLGRAMWKQMPYLELIGVKMTRPFSLIPFKAIVTAALTGQENEYIETIPCSPQAIEPFALSSHDDIQVVCKSMTPSKIESDSDSYCCPDPSWNPNCMTMSDWVKV